MRKALRGPGPSPVRRGFGLAWWSCLGRARDASVTVKTVTGSMMPVTVKPSRCGSWDVRVGGSFRRGRRSTARRVSARCRSRVRGARLRQLPHVHQVRLWSRSSSSSLYRHRPPRNFVYLWRRAVRLWRKSLPSVLVGNADLKFRMTEHLRNSDRSLGVPWT